MDGRWQARETPSRPRPSSVRAGSRFRDCRVRKRPTFFMASTAYNRVSFGPCYARCKVLPGFRAVQIQSLRLLQAIPLVDTTRLRASPTIAAIFPPAVLKVRPPAAREVLGRGATTTIPHRKIADAERGAMPDGKGRALQVRAGNPNKDNDYLIDRAAQKGEDS